MRVTLEKLLYNLCQLAIKNKLVNYAASGASFKQLNGTTVSDYPILFIQPRGQHKYYDTYTLYSFNIMYMDRLLDDDSNDVNIYSTSIEVLKNFMHQMSETEYVLGFDNESIYFENFVDTHAQNDRVAGTLLTLKIKVPNETNCYEE